MSPARGGNRADALARLDAIQQQSLDRLHNSDANRALLVELLEASCLLELAKIEATRLDPTSYLQLAVDVIAQMYPVQGVAATVTPPDSPAIDVHSGVNPTNGRRIPLVAGGKTIGALVAGAVNVELGESDRFFELVAAQIAQGLATTTHAEQLRREAATATAARVASQLADDAVVDGLEELALALASFPSTIAAELVVDHPVVGPPLRLRAGRWESDGTAHSIESITLELAGTGRITARLRSSDVGMPDEASVEQVLKLLADSLERIARTQVLQEQAETEPLTGLGNRRRLQRTLDQALVRARRYHEQVALVLLDLDRFKPVNDELGHETGDAVIVACAHALRDCTRSYDEIIRLGGDEFVAVAPVADLLDALRLADDIRKEIAARCGAVLPPDWGLTATIGVAIFPEAADDPEGLLRAADTALYAAKAAGRDGVMIAEPSDADMKGPMPGSFLTGPAAE